MLSFSLLILLLPPQIPPIGALTGKYYTGHQLNAYYGYSRYTMEFCGGILVVYIVVCRIIAYLGLRYIKV